MSEATCPAPPLTRPGLAALSAGLAVRFRTSRLNGDLAPCPHIGGTPAPAIWDAVTGDLRCFGCADTDLPEAGVGICGRCRLAANVRSGRLIRAGTVAALVRLCRSCERWVDLVQATEPRERETERQIR